MNKPVLDYNSGARTARKPLGPGWSFLMLILGLYSFGGTFTWGAEWQIAMVPLAALFFTAGLVLGSISASTSIRKIDRITAIVGALLNVPPAGILLVALIGYWLRR
ncbi:MAG: hypothetical protein ACHRHE_14735 [Tepidisphaerales bacterium]